MAPEPSTPGPLVAFSLYTAVQVGSLDRVGRDLLTLSDSWKQPDGSYHVSEFMKYTDLFWLWVLGAYEVLRTMRQHSSCFTPALHEQTSLMTRRLAEVRIPFAKQELRGNGRPVFAELSVSSFGRGPIFKIAGSGIDASMLIEDTLAFFNSIEEADIKQMMPLGIQED